MKSKSLVSKVPASSKIPASAESHAKIPIIAIVGPTATGKSDVAVSLAKKFNGEIISADSRQVYIGLDLGSGKITKKEMRGVPHYLLDVVSARTVYNAAKFKKTAEKIIEDIHSRGKLPIIVGGTGFWIDTLLNNTQLPGVKPNPVLRKKISNWPVAHLYKELWKLDPARAENIDRNNPVRLIRAIEVAIGLKVLAKMTRVSKNISKRSPGEPKYLPLYIGLDTNSELLRQRIHKRLTKRIELGMAKEVAKVHANGVSWKRLDELGLEYRFVSQMLRDELKPEKMQELLEIAIWHFAKRQRTWFYRNAAIHWLDVENKKEALVKASNLVEDFKIDQNF
jgi:tRNA dimethylallyltransferase